MTTLEKLCRAACEADGVNPDTMPRNPTYGGGAAWEFYRPTVEAILAALEDPSDEMVSAFQEATVNQWATIPGLKKGFTAMIRKAKEG